MSMGCIKTANNDLANEVIIIAGIARGKVRDADAMYRPDERMIIASVSGLGPRQCLIKYFVRWGRRFSFVFVTVVSGLLSFRCFVLMLVTKSWLGGVHYEHPCFCSRSFCRFFAFTITCQQDPSACFDVTMDFWLDPCRGDSAFASCRERLGQNCEGPPLCGDVQCFHATPKMTRLGL